MPPRLPLLFVAASFAMIANSPLEASPKVFRVTSPNQAGSPGTYRTIAEAVAAAQKAGGEDDTVIEVSGGVHRLGEPIVLSSEHLANRKGLLIFRAAEGSEPVLSGGREVTSWTLHDAGRGIWKSELAAPAPTRNLIVNGQRAVRACSVAGLNEPQADDTGYRAKNPEMASWKNPDKIECVYRAIWTNPRCPIAAITPEADGVRIEMVQPGWTFCRNKGITSVKDPWYLENAYELLDEPGEWYLDETGAVAGKPWTLFYKPQPWEDMTKTTAVVPVLENLFVFEGTTEKPAAGIRFEGLTFADTTWLRPSSERGHPDAQNNVIRENMKGGGEFVGDGAALRFHTSRDIAISGCRFHNLGGTGILMTGGANDNRITGNAFVDIAANGIQIGDYLDWPNADSPNNPSVANPVLQIANIAIKNNFFWRCGVEYRSATAIGLTFPKNSVIANNEIFHMPYIGFHMGWGWIRIAASNTADNVIANNHIENVMVELADGAGIYTLGASASKDHPTVIRDNYIRRSRWGHALYFDEGSSFYNVDHNAAVDAVDFNVKVNGPTSNTIKVTRLFAPHERNTVTEGAKQIEIEPAIIISDETRPQLEKLKAGAGLEKDYAPIRWTPRDPRILELEEGWLVLPARTTSGLGTGVSGYLGMGYVEGLGTQAGASITRTFTMSEAEERELVIRSSLVGGPVEGVELVVNDSPAIAFTPEPTGNANTWSTWTTKVKLPKGSNSIQLRDVAGKTEGLLVDRIELRPIQPH
jgi:hypothetical protein